MARGLGRTCVTGVEGLLVDPVARVATLPGGVTLLEGTVVSVDGTAGEVYAGQREIEPSAVSTAIEEGAAHSDDPTVRAVLTLLAQADLRRRLGVMANAETPDEARMARRFGAEGIGLCRTEHMLLGERRVLVERLVTDEDREGALAEIEALAHAEFTALLETMEGLPVVVRLLDPPMHEFLPDLVDLSVTVALAEEHGSVEPALERRLSTTSRWHESNPMLGLRGVRLLTVLPQIIDVQVRALAEATVELRAGGHDVRPELMVPLVADVAELTSARTRMEGIVAEVARAHDTTLHLPIGVMVELPRAALTAAELARHADFFSFGTNDLTQTTWGISRDDAEANFLAAYREAGLLTTDPFKTIDEEGVGALVQLAARDGRRTCPDLGLGACGEHAGDPASIAFFARAGVDHLSCSPPRIPVVRLEAGRQAVLLAGPSHGTADTR